MASPFPGMDPFLEDPAIFPDLHDSLIYRIREALNARLPEPYFTAIASRVWIETSERRIEPDVNVLKPNGSPPMSGPGGGVAVTSGSATAPVLIRVPREEVRETFLEIRSSPGGERLVTTVEVLSLANKTPSGHGRTPYLTKQREILDSSVNLVEIDLLRAGMHTTAVPAERFREAVGMVEYHICVHRFDQPGDFLVFPVRLPQPLPTVNVPLLPGEGEIPLDLQTIFTKCYDTALYNRRVDYRRPPPGAALAPDLEAWLDRLLRDRGLRPASP